MGTHRKIEKETIFFDGICNLCNGAVNFVIDRDKQGRYQFSSLQSDIAHEVLPQEARDLESIVLVTPAGKVYKKSNAALEIARHIGGLWFLLYGFKIVPKFIRDGVYNFIAKNRYAWFGKRDTCRLPTPELKERFLEAS